MAYENPTRGPMAYLLQPAQRELLAETVNSSLLGRCLGRLEPCFLPTFLPFTSNISSFASFRFSRFSPLVAAGRPPESGLKLALRQASDCLNLLQQADHGVAAFLDFKDYIAPQ